MATETMMLTCRGRLRPSLTVAMLLSGVSAVAWAHVRLVSSSPAASSRVAMPPAVAVVVLVLTAFLTGIASPTY